MPRNRPMEGKRAKSGLGARTPEGDTIPATPKGRMTGAPGGQPARKKK